LARRFFRISSFTLGDGAVTPARFSSPRVRGWDMDESLLDRL
jgi:hypothetical protein